MKRQQQRQINRILDKTITLTHKQLHERIQNELVKYREDIGHAACVTTLDMMCALFLATLHCDYKFGKKRLDLVMQQVYTKIISVADNTADINKFKYIVNKAGCDYKAYFDVKERIM